MPTYQYACTDAACGHRFEAVQSFSDDPLSVCPQCESRLRKVFSAVGVVFKGSGFYRNDSRADSNGSSSKSTPSNGKNGSSSDTSSTSSSSSTSSGSADSSSTSSGSGSTSKAAAS